MSLEAAAAAVADDARERSSGAAVVVLRDGEQGVHLDAGADPLTAHTRFDIGSIAKTVTALLLAEMVTAAEVELDAPAAREMTFLQLATHTSGLPRLPANLMAKAAETPDDPYRDYTVADLAEAVDAVTVTPGPPAYSNFGFMVLAEALAAAAGTPFAELVVARVLQPLGLDETAVGWPAGAERVPGYAANRQVPDWTLQVLGLGGLTSTITDLARYLTAQLRPDDTPLAAAIRLTHTGHGPHDLPLGWQRDGTALGHNGGTGGFASFCAYDPATDRAVAILTNRAHSLSVDAAGRRALTAD